METITSGVGARGGPLRLRATLKLGNRIVGIRDTRSPVADLLRHSSIAITGDVYGHTSDDTARAAEDGRTPWAVTVEGGWV